MQKCKSQYKKIDRQLTLKMYTAAFAHALYTIIKQISYNQNMDALMSENLIQSKYGHAKPHIKNLCR